MRVTAKILVADFDIITAHLHVFEAFPDISDDVRPLMRELFKSGQFQVSPPLGRVGKIAEGNALPAHTPPGLVNGTEAWTMDTKDVLTLGLGIAPPWRLVGQRLDNRQATQGASHRDGR